MLGSNKTKLVDRNIFVKNIPKSIRNPEDLEKHFTALCKHSTVKCSKISVSGDHESNGYGFVLVNDTRDVDEILEACKNDTEMVPNRFAPKDKKDFAKAINNVYIKNIPATWTEKELVGLFGKYGDISSAFIVRNQKSDFVAKGLVNEEEKGEKTAFGFVCYDKKDDKNYGPECAAKAVENLNNFKIDEEHILYVKPALSKNEREIEKRKDMLRYKNSKKRCNLYVKNFPA